MSGVPVSINSPGRVYKSGQARRRDSDVRRTTHPRSLGCDLLSYLVKVIKPACPRLYVPTSPELLYRVQFILSGVGCFSHLVLFEGKTIQSCAATASNMLTTLGTAGFARTY